MSVGFATTAPEAARIESHCDRILALLTLREASNGELARISLKYTGRISDLRKRGYQIKCVRRNRETGQSWYRLIGPVAPRLF